MDALDSSSLALIIYFTLSSCYGTETAVSVHSAESATKMVCLARSAMGDQSGRQYLRERLAVGEVGGRCWRSWRRSKWRSCWTGWSLSLVGRCQSFTRPTIWIREPWLAFSYRVERRYYIALPPDILSLYVLLSFDTQDRVYGCLALLWG